MNCPKCGGLKILSGVTYHYSGPICSCPLEPQILTPQFQFVSFPDLKPNKKKEVSRVHGSSFVLFPKPPKKPSKCNICLKIEMQGTVPFKHRHIYLGEPKQMAKKPHQMPKVAKKKKSKPKIAKLPKIKSLEAKLKSILYPLIKKEEPNECVSCGKKNMVGRDHQVGHFIKAELCNLVWRYNRPILHPQCSACNLWKRGNYVEYRKWMIKKYGERDVQIMESLYNETLPLSFNPREFLLSTIKKYDNARI